MVWIAHKSHLLGVKWLLLVDFARLNGQALRLDMHSASCALATIVLRVVGLASSSLGRLLLSDTHVLWLHHVR